MAMTINSGPVLTGESARVFIEEFEKNNKLPRYELSEEEEQELLEIECKSREFMARLKQKLHGK